MAGSWLRPEEQTFWRRAQDWLDQAVSRQTWRLTDFLNPREQQLLAELAHQRGWVTAAYGGGTGAERCRVILMPDDWQPQEEDFQITVLSVTAARSLSHGSVLGSLLGTGLDRRRVGDIAVTGQQAWVAVCREVADYLLGQWRYVGRTPVQVDFLPGAAALPPPAYEVQQVYVASLRADAVLSAACRWPRSQAQAAVRRGEVSLHHIPLARPDEQLAPGDILSVRGFGRVRLLSVQGESRSGRLRVELGVLRSRSAH
ncbi:MAG: hypothetical protein K6T26_06815 [Alicyclobacillus sp.]|nr:hypothetical protein [Alicyclobacillus sp.]